MTNLNDVVMYLFPNIIPIQDYQIGDDGSGQRIVAWSYIQPQPTADVLEVNAQNGINLATLRDAKATALSLLEDSDLTILRCMENGVAVPQEWSEYRKSLRAIAKATDISAASIPSKPAFPAGT